MGTNLSRPQKAPLAGDERKTRYSDMSALEDRKVFQPDPWRHAGNDLKDEGGAASFCVTDVTNLDQVKALAEEAVKQFGHVDVLVNNAGLIPLSRLVELKVDEM